jgi:hypothetical protein
LVFGSMHVPPQSTSVPGHVSVQPPAPSQTRPEAAQFRPALPASPAPQPAVAPQYWLLCVGSMHVPLQSISLPGHETEHWPLAQTSPDGHCVPALPASPAPQPAVAPQWCWSEVGSMHLPPQLISPLGHETEQAPPLQTCPAGHCVPGLPEPPAPHAPVAPQYWLSLDGSTHRPLQLTSVPGHATAQLPPPHALPVGQTLLHPPQWFGSFCSSTQSDVPPAPGHVERPPPHWLAHWPPEQSWPAEHAWPQPPQLLGSTFVSMQDEPHSVEPPPQLSEHCPLEHTWPLVHALPQEPQLAGSTLVATQTPPQAVWPTGHAPASLGASAVLDASVPVSLGASELVSVLASPAG